MPQARERHALGNLQASKQRPTALLCKPSKQSTLTGAIGDDPLLGKQMIRTLDYLSLGGLPEPLGFYWASVTR
jgi:hypothetical protein